MSIFVLILGVIIASIKTGHIEELEVDIISKINVFGIFLFFSIFLDFLRKLIKYYFDLESIKISPWDLISNDYAMIT